MLPEINMCGAFHSSFVTPLLPIVSPAAARGSIAAGERFFHRNGNQHHDFFQHLGVSQ
jgi:hypothetical protein